MIPDDDAAFLSRKGWRWRTSEVGLSDGKREIHLVILDYPLPDRFAPRTVELLVRIFPGYPAVGLDMFWTIPDVTEKATGRLPNATDVHETHGGRLWQRWSRHMNGWRSGVDNLETYFAAIQKELNR